MLTKRSIFLLPLYTILILFSHPTQSRGDRLKELENEHKKAQELIILKEHVTKLIKENNNLSHLDCTNSPLLNRGIYKFPELVQALIERKADLEVKDEFGHTPLHLAIDSRDIKNTLLLLEAGANPNSMSKGTLGTTLTPLIKAILEGQLEMVEALIKNGAKLNKQAGYTGEKTPLTHAFSHGLNPLLQQKNRINIIELLLAHGADPDVINGDGSTALSALQKQYADHSSSILRQNDLPLDREVGKILVYYSIVRKFLRGLVLNEKTNLHLPEEIIAHIMGYLFINQETCSICLENLYTGTTIANCKHTQFHKHCIEAWQKKSKECPLCRAVAKTV